MTGRGSVSSRPSPARPPIAPLACRRRLEADGAVGAVVGRLTTWFGLPPLLSSAGVATPLFPGDKRPNRLLRRQHAGEYPVSPRPGHVPVTCCEGAESGATEGRPEGDWGSTCPRGGGEHPVWGATELIGQNKQRPAAGAARSGPLRPLLLTRTEMARAGRADTLPGKHARHVRPLCRTGSV